MADSSLPTSQPPLQLIEQAVQANQSARQLETAAARNRYNRQRFFSQFRNPQALVARTRNQQIRSETMDIQDQQPPTVISWSPAALAAALETIKTLGCPMCLEDGQTLLDKRTPVAVLTTNEKSFDDQNQQVDPLTNSKKDSLVYHAFCQGCIFRWFVTRFTCPLCRVRQTAPILLTDDLSSASSYASKCAILQKDPSAELLGHLHHVYMRVTTWRCQAYYYCYAAEVITKLGVEDESSNSMDPDDPNLKIQNNHHFRPKWLTFDRFCDTIKDLSDRLQVDISDVYPDVVLSDQNQSFNWNGFNEASPKEHLITYYRCFLYMYNYHVATDKLPGFRKAENDNDEDEDEDSNDINGNKNDDDKDKDKSIACTSTSTLAKDAKVDKNALEPVSTIAKPKPISISRLKMLDFLVEDLVMLNWIFPVINYGRTTSLTHYENFFANCWPEISVIPKRPTCFPEPFGQNLMTMFSMVQELIDRSLGPVTVAKRIEFNQNSFLRYFAQLLYFPSFSSKKASGDRFRAMYDDFINFTGSLYQSHRLFLLNTKFELKEEKDEMKLIAQTPTNSKDDSLERTNVAAANLNGSGRKAKKSLTKNSSGKSKINFDKNQINKKVKTN